MAILNFLMKGYLSGSDYGVERQRFRGSLLEINLLLKGKNF